MNKVQRNDKGDARSEIDLSDIAKVNHEAALNLVAGLPLDHPQQAQADRVGYYRSLVEGQGRVPPTNEDKAFYLRIQARIIANITKALDPSEASAFFGTTR